MISVAEARQRITSALRPLAAEQVSLSEAHGRVLAQDVVSRVTQPPQAVSAMDGYAVRGVDVADVPATLSVIGSAPAGSAFQGSVGPGQAVRIFTGAPLPDGSDTIVIQENTRRPDEDTVTVEESAALGTYVRPAGLDFAAGDVLLPAGRTLGARDVGLAAAMNVPWLMVRRRPRVAILSTGDEVVMPGDPIGPDQIVSSNGLALASAVRAFGGTPALLGIAPDDSRALQTMAAGAKGADMLVTTGGASVGDHDLIKDALGETGLRLEFFKIAMRPGKPLIFGDFNGTPMLGLPGNPVSSLVCAIMFLQPAMAVLLGLDDTAVPLQTARLGGALPANDRREVYLRARLSTDADGTPVATAFEVQDSSMMATLTAADCLIVRPPHAPAAAAGERVQILPLQRGICAV